MNIPVQPQWREVSYLEFDRYLREYRWPLVPDPPLNQPAQMREWFDTGIGRWPNNVVARLLEEPQRSYLVREIG